MMRRPGLIAGNVIARHWRGLIPECFVVAMATCLIVGTISVSRAASQGVTAQNVTAQNASSSSASLPNALSSNVGVQSDEMSLAPMPADDAASGDAIDDEVEREFGSGDPPASSESTLNARDFGNIIGQFSRLDQKDRWAISQAILGDWRFVVQDADDLPVGPAIAMPTDRRKTAGVRIRIDASLGFRPPGYLPLTITATPTTQRFTADRQFTLRFAPPPDARPAVRRAVVEVPMVAEQNQTVATMRIDVPIYTLCDQIECAVIESGQPLDGYRETLRFHNPTALESDRFETFLASERFHDIGSFDDLIHDAVPTGVDVVFIEPKQFASLGDNQTATEAIRKYLLSGRTIVAFDGTTQQWGEVLGVAINPTAFDGVEAVMVRESLQNGEPALMQERLLKFDPRDYPAIIAVGNQSISNRNVLNSFALPSSIATDVSAIDADLPAFTSEQLDAIFNTRIGAGRLLRMPPMSYRRAMFTLRSVMPLETSETLRRGFEPMMGDSRFGNWLIPGVAQPPVYTFIGLLGVFVIMVGPIAYRKTTRSGRGYLMFLIAPILALLTTTAMFAYGLIADGLGTRTRIRTLTLVDGRSGDAIDRTRATYFAGIRPGDGLSFARDDRVFPYYETGGLSFGDIMATEPQTPPRIRIDDRQRFPREFLPSRSQRQFVTIRDQPKLGRLEVITPGDGTQIELQSDFPFKLSRVTVRDFDGAFYGCESIDARGTQVADRIPQAVTPGGPINVGRRLGDLYNDFRPLTEITQTRSPRNYRDRTDEIYDLVTLINSRVSSSVISTDGFTENLLNAWLKSGSMPTGTFVAITDIDPDVLAIDDAEVIASVRYVIGTMPR